MHREDSSSKSEPLGDGQLLSAYRNGDEAAASELFRRYYARLLKLARRRMGKLLREVEESADVAQSVFESVFVRGRAGQIEVGPSDSLWPLLVTITVHKICNRARYWRRGRRDRVLHVPLVGWDPLETGPKPEDATRLEDLIDRLLEPFSPTRRKTIEYLLQDCPPAEIAQRVGISKRTVYRTRSAAMEILQKILAAS